MLGGIDTCGVKIRDSALWSKDSNRRIGVSETSGICSSRPRRRSLDVNNSKVVFLSLYITLKKDNTLF